MVTRLDDGVWWCDLGGVNAYLVDDGGTLTLVDTGMPWHGQRLAVGVGDAGYSLRAVDRVLITHYDLDHVGGLSRLRGLDATVYVGAADAPFLTGERRPPVSNRKGLFQRATEPLVGRTDLPVERVTDGDEVGSFEVYHTPGHTPGHTAFVSESMATAVLGDLVRESDGEVMASPWLLSHDAEAVRESIRAVAERAPPFEVAAMGHGVPFNRHGGEVFADLAGRV